ncbi:MAG: dockerin type I repeat-containing protein [Candidatus Parcubacteria bacterium]|nr:dockerin type I repeat-containing protein [Candidatus Parcubacteria bacterium]
MKIYRSFLLISIFILGLVAAPDFIYGLSCTLDSDCPTNQVCRSTICIFESGTGFSVRIGPIEEEEAPSTPSSSPSPAPAAVIFQGKAFPSAFITILKDNYVAATFLADSKGTFYKNLIGLPAGMYSFGIRAQDSEGRDSVTLNFKTELINGFTVDISGIFIPPTISVSSSNIKKGESVDILGQVFDGSDVNAFIFPEGIFVKAENLIFGRWLLKLDTGQLAEGEHNVRAKAFFNGEQSLFSESVSFFVSPSGEPAPTPTSTEPLACKGADLNSNGKVDLVDFSILLYFWGQNQPANACADMNADGVVDIIDFSIMMYYWTE